MATFLAPKLKDMRRRYREILGDNVEVSINKAELNAAFQAIEDQFIAEDRAQWNTEINTAIGPSTITTTERAAIRNAYMTVQGLDS